VKELLTSNSICGSYAQMKKGPVFSDSQCIYTKIIRPYKHEHLKVLSLIPTLFSY